MSSAQRNSSDTVEEKPTSDLLTSGKSVNLNDLNVQLIGLCKLVGLSGINGFLGVTSSLLGFSNEILGAGTGLVTFLLSNILFNDSTDRSFVTSEEMSLILSSCGTVFDLGLFDRDFSSLSAESLRIDYALFLPRP